MWVFYVKAFWRVVPLACMFGFLPQIIINMFLSWFHQPNARMISMSAYIFEKFSGEQASLSVRMMFEYYTAQANVVMLSSRGRASSSCVHRARGRFQESLFRITRYCCMLRQHKPGSNVLIIKMGPGTSVFLISAACLLSWVTASHTIMIFGFRGSYNIPIFQ